MTARNFIIVTLSVLVFLSCSSRSVVEEQSSDDPSAAANNNQKNIWGWDYLGPRGPENWASLNKKYETCSRGKSQSPINLVWHKPSKPNPLKINYRESRVSVTNTGYTFRIELTPESSIAYGGKEYILEKIEFRSGSEHTLSGNRLPMELQFYHRSSNGLKQAIISLFAISGKQGEWFKTIWKHAANLSKQKTSKNFRFDPSKLIPPRQTFYHYEGSMTHPPCLEGVQWFVFNTPLQLSNKQFGEFRTIYNGNTRPVQPLNGRKVTNF